MKATVAYAYFSGCFLTYAWPRECPQEDLLEKLAWLATIFVLECNENGLYKEIHAYANGRSPAVKVRPSPEVRESDGNVGNHVGHREKCRCVELRLLKDLIIRYILLKCLRVDILEAEAS